MNLIIDLLYFLVKSYMTIDRTELCDCLLSVGTDYLAQTMVTCSDMGPDSDRGSLNEVFLQ